MRSYFPVEARFQAQMLTAEREHILRRYFLRPLNEQCSKIFLAVAAGVFFPGFWRCISVKPFSSAVAKKINGGIFLCLKFQ